MGFFISSTGATGFFPKSEVHKTNIHRFSYISHRFSSFFIFPWVWLMALVGATLAKNLAMNTAASCIADFVPPIHQGAVSGFYSAATAVGSLAGYYYFGWLAQDLPLPWTYIVLIIVFIMCFILTSIAVREPEALPGSAPDRQSSAA